MRSISLLLVLLLAGEPAAAQPQDGAGWRLGDASAPPDPARATRDGFGVMMLVTPDYEGFLTAWAGATPPEVSTTAQMTRGQPVHAMLLFSGCGAGPDGNCNVTAELSVVSPDGSPYGETLRGTMWSGPPAPAHNLQLSQSTLGFVLEPEDPLGTYTFRADVTDNVAGTTLRVEKSVTATAPAG